ncbi:Cyanobacterial phytochrome B [Fulvivirga imtechensis AK7]|uniref:histidine kinase n=1 Tax=Fulvivirga imtechensis AK7 TaxID=1237149 RepID=L8JXY2_9BACT|nr:PAS domain S-box protein [Fulvivirga imtechensis]ELR73033.1 Cyanobacterial phytochrome B [Fulvivirga imtechensis AK7]
MHHKLNTRSSGKADLTALSMHETGDWSLIEQLPVAIYACDMQGRITFFNEAAVKLWGRTPVLGKDLWCGSWKIYDTGGVPMSLGDCPMAIALKEKRDVLGYEIVIERPDGVRMNVLPHPKPLLDPAGKMTGAINMLVDISEKREREQILRKNEKKYKSLTESLEKIVEERTLTLKKSEERYHKMIEEVQDYAIILLDTDGNISNWNKGAQQIKGYSEDEIIGKNFRIFYRQQDRDKKFPEQLIEMAKNDGRAIHEGWRVRKDGSTFWGSIVITALHDDENNIIGFSKVTRDLTERKQAEDKMKKYLRDIEIRNRQLEEFAFVASHDLQEPLRKIQIFSELAERNIDDKEAAKRNLSKINSSAQRMVMLIKGVLEYSKLSRHEELFATVDLSKTLRNVREDFDLLIREKGADIIYTNLPTVKGIPIQIHQLFSNLLSNALKFTDRDPVIEIEAETLANEEIRKYPNLSANGKYIKFTFKDNGQGFDSRYSDQAFKLFQRLDHSERGAGVGLALCKRIIENHKGHIEVLSKPNEGTTFLIILPAE